MNELAAKTIVCVIVISMVLAMASTIGAVCIPYTINHWLVYFGNAPVIEWWHGALLIYIPVIGQAAVPAAVATWIASLFIG